jgi:hypothetical protein
MYQTVVTTNLNNYVYFNKSEAEEFVNSISEKKNLNTQRCLNTAVNW